MDMGNKRVLHISPIIGIKSFGIGNVALNMAHQQLKSGWDVNIWCLEDEHIFNFVREEYGIENQNVKIFPGGFPKKLYYSASMENIARRGKTIPQIVHQHNLWTAISRVTQIFHNKHNVPTIISPHGALQQWALNNSKIKKKIVSKLYEHNNLNNANCLHALSLQEIDDIREYGLKNPIALVSNGVSKKWMEWEGDAQRFRRKHSIPSSTRIALFMSRITPKKGISLLLNAISQNIKKKDWIFIFAGSDENNHLKDVQTLANKLGISENVKFIGLIQGIQKHDAFAASELFILPSYSEGAPICVLEAMGKGVPVLVTTATPMEEIVDNYCGWRVEAVQDSISQTLSLALEKSPKELKIMGENGRSVILNNYTWKQKVIELNNVYNWLCNGGEKPRYIYNY